MPHVPDWMPEEELQLLAEAPKAEVKMSSLEAETLAMQIFRDNLPLAAQIICDIATHSDNERTQLTAAKYVVERTMGKTPESRPPADEDNPLTRLFGNVIREPTADERASGTKVSRI